MMKKGFLSAFILGMLLVGAVQAQTISDKLSWSERTALSVMRQNPEPWMIEFMEKPVWSYPQGLMLTAFEKLAQKTGKTQYNDYVMEYLDGMISEGGVIKTYQQETFNIDMINSGKLLFKAYENTGEDRYLIALKTLRNQLRWQPKTTDGGFWHKLRYPWQMWLDGAYMGTPFLIRYGVEFEEPEAIDQGILQLVLLEKHLRDEKTGLLYHGYDESRLQQWSDPDTGKSPEFWGRAMGWYAMALVDALDYIPESHSGRAEVQGILGRLAKAILPYQNSETGLWYQVVDKGEEAGNFEEASVSAMFAYALAKGANSGHLDISYRKVAENCLEGMLENMVEVTDDGEIHLHQVCAVAGLGGNPYRDGTYDYYINEKIKTNDPKGVGPFIMACIALEK
ncbi:glycoside hydrolase family 105 protein [Belliella marina]|uniref:Glycoside hydrolase family 105 protein n=1 Tax=Belliella marina TaxID=1644146 RepID=A0ABW4VT48_9BACT